MSNQMDEKINKLFQVVSKQKQEVEAAEKESKQPWKTTASYQIEGASNPVNLQTASEAKVTDVVMSLLRRRQFSAEATKILGLPATDKYDGFTYDDWITDCKKRIAVLGIRAKKEQLAELESRLNNIVSPEQKRQMELDAITASLGLND